jgi:adenylosuccinate lyase
MSEQGYMHRRVQVEVAWFIALSDAGFAEFKPLSPAARAYLLGLVKNFSEADALAIKDIEKTTNHDVKAVEYWIKSKFEGHPELEKRQPSSCTLPAPAKTSTTPATRCMLQAGRDQVLLPALDRILHQAARDGPPMPACPCSAAPTARPPAPPPWARKWPTWWCACSPRASASPRVKLLAKMNGAVGNYNAHLSAWPDFDWEAFSRKVVETPEPLGLGLTFQPYSIQIEPHDYMAELFDAVARANTILIDLGARRLGLHQPGLLQAAPQGGRNRLVTMPHKVNPIDFENAEGNLGLANALLRHLSREAAHQPLAARPDRQHRAAQHGRGAGLRRCWPTQLAADRPEQAGTQRGSAGRRPGRRLGSAGRADPDRDAPLRRARRLRKAQGSHARPDRHRRGPARPDPLAGHPAGRKRPPAGHDATRTTRICP